MAGCRERFYWLPRMPALKPAPLLQAEPFNHKASWRYVVNPAGSTARVHQHLNIGEGEIDWDLFFRTLSEVGFDGIMTSQVFAYLPEKAPHSSRFMRERIQHCVDQYWTKH